jgi:hypothetical protein
VPKPPCGHEEQQHEEQQQEHGKVQHDEHNGGKSKQLSKAQRRKLCDLKYAREEDCAQEGKARLGCELQFGPEDELCIQAARAERNCLGRSLCPSEFLKQHVIPNCEFAGMPTASAGGTKSVGSSVKVADNRKNVIACQAARRRFDACMDEYMQIEFKSKWGL